MRSNWNRSVFTRQTRATARAVGVLVLGTIIAARCLAGCSSTQAPPPQEVTKAVARVLACIVGEALRTPLAMDAGAPGDAATGE